MYNHEKNKIQEIPPEKMAILAERGLKAAKLTKEEKHYLLNGGLEELYDIWEFKKQTISPLTPETVATIMEKMHKKKLQPVSDIWVRIQEKLPELINLELVKLAECWRIGAPAFECRGKGDGSKSFSTKVGELTVQLDIVARDEKHADIHVCLTETTGKRMSSCKVELYREDKCIEIVSTSKGDPILLSAIESGNYQLRVSDSRGDITSFSITME